MRIFWDEPKRLANLEKHGLDFADVFAFDWASAKINASHNDAYRRSRFKAVGWYQNGVAVVIYAELGTEAISVVSFRPANVREKRILYD